MSAATDGNTADQEMADVETFPVTYTGAAIDAFVSVFMMTHGAKYGSVFASNMQMLVQGCDA